MPIDGFTFVGLQWLRHQPGSPGSQPCQHSRNGLGGGLSGEPSCDCHARFALMENEHRPCTLTNDEVTLPVAALGSGECNGRVTIL